MKSKTHFIFVLIFCISISSNTIHAAGVETKLVLNCGTEEAETDTEGRKWEPATKYLATQANSIGERALSQDPSLESTVPYMTARIFTAENSYKLPAKSNARHLLRLHFYPSTYGTVSQDDAYFSVTANGLTLLKNFSASITAKALTQAMIVREFSLAPTHSGELLLTFKPSDQHNGAYAFINGIELIEMPNLFGSALVIGSSGELMETNTANLQTMYRLNVGGNYIPATNDSLSRTWYDDSPYLFGASLGRALTNSSLPLKFSEISKSSAPEDVYTSWRAMTEDPKINENFNLTWVFQVDANFTYLIRMHFCEIVYSRINQRVFDIYLNNQTAYDAADVIGWTTSAAVPIHKDFVLYVKDEPGDDHLWVALHPDINSKPEFYDAILNGLEIFKMSEGESLAGPNPVLSDLLVKNEVRNKASQGKAPQQKDGVGVAHVAAGGAAAAVVAALCIVVYTRKNKIAGGESRTSSWLPIYSSSHSSGTKSTISGKSTNGSHVSTLAASLCRHFSLAEIKRATGNFNESQVIGVGGFGKVYRGVIDGDMKVAIKRSNPSSEQGVNEFQTEIEMLSKLRHRHLVSLIGFCEEDGEMALVYDYMHHGTLREHLYKSGKPQLSWKQRLEICIGAARGLHYLHTGARYTIIHRDVKTTNILLNENWIAKVSDFGLSKTGPSINRNHVSTVVKGSFGYLDPEYFRRQQLTEKSDVYSFGVVLFEVLCARPALNPNLTKEQVSLADWALHCQRKGTLEDIIDPHLKGKIVPQCLKKFAETAEKCLSDHGADRPSMGDVLWNLEFALQLQENSGNVTAGAPESDNSGSEEEPHRINPAVHMSTLSLGSDFDLNEKPEDDSVAIFSQIVDQKGR
ncbi:Malectin-like domain [Dillenia turbinata]|uniref:non-specific serine/threonine protein kinase n=1 Tax=Dillenia turbinata TaxID=194707 RepID=A0AAN8VVS5_9MAGN